MAPEVLGQKQYGLESDAFSFGVVSYYMLYGKYPFMGQSEYELLQNIKASKFSFNPQVKVSDTMKDFLKQLL